MEHGSFDPAPKEDKPGGGFSPAPRLRFPERFAVSFGRTRLGISPSERGACLERWWAGPRLLIRHSEVGSDVSDDASG